MLAGISQFANQSYGLPVREVAYQVETKVKATKKVNVVVIETYTLKTKQLPKE